ncbi:hypothetical protein [Brevibacillus laterosporus]|uniref:hypothetical protein n=1 Tax=Brevibacillus laterosporus TaxID=1465 RepID=UPI00399C8710
MLGLLEIAIIGLEGQRDEQNGRYELVSLLCDVQHFCVNKGDKGVKTTYSCSRLGYETKPSYRFDCWQPTERVCKLVEKENLSL